jgi:transmembrane sensor
MGQRHAIVFSLRMTDSRVPPPPQPPPSDAAPSPGAVPPDWETISRYLDGDAPAVDQSTVARWLAEHPGDAAMLTALDGTLARWGAQQRSPVNVEDALARVTDRRRQDAPALTLHEGGAPRKPRHWIGVVTGLAAAALLGVVVLRPPADQTPPVATVAQTVHRAAVGSRDSVRLSDGTRVMLAPGSELVVAAGYGEGSREVSLVGEGWFDVVHDDRRPFTVRARQALVRDIGTRFTVLAVAAAPVRVVVTEGAVAVRPTATSDEVRLDAGDVASIPESGTPSVARASATSDDTAWLQDRLVFREAPMTEVTAALQRWYGITVVVGDSAVAGRHLTATFANEPRSRVLSMLSLALGASIEQHGDSAILRAQR